MPQMRRPRPRAWREWMKLMWRRPCRPLWQTRPIWCAPKARGRQLLSWAW
ncbi:MAG: hypothetical protein MZV64_50490 [Ignavibacteriales bacterium]|nr:hypothetical protein [Ignavibacteriales bacterium]